MSRPENLDWLADEEGNLRPDVAEALAADPGPDEDLYPTPLWGAGDAGRWVLRGLLILSAVWLVVRFIEWLVLLCFLVGLVVRVFVAPNPEPGPGARERRMRSAVRPLAEEVPLHGTGRMRQPDTDPALAVGEE